MFFNLFKYREIKNLWQKLIKIGGWNISRWLQFENVILKRLGDNVKWVLWLGYKHWIRFPFRTGHDSRKFGNEHENIEGLIWFLETIKKMVFLVLFIATKHQTRRLDFLLLLPCYFQDTNRAESPKGNTESLSLTHNFPFGCVDSFFLQTWQKINTVLRKSHFLVSPLFPIQFVAGGGWPRLLPKCVSSHHIITTIFSRK